MSPYRPKPSSSVSFLQKSPCLEENTCRWKISGQIPSVDMRISDVRLFRIISHLQSFSSSQSATPDETPTPLWTTATTEFILESLASLTEEEETEKTADNFTQIEGSFELPKVRMPRTRSRSTEILSQCFRLIFFWKKKKMEKNIPFFAFHSSRCLLRYFSIHWTSNFKRHWMI